MHVLKAALRGTDIKANLLAHMPREMVAEELRKADIHVFPSVYEETFGLCLVEAMASSPASL